MTPEISEWIEKAEDDYATMSREFQVTNRPNFDAVCFHAQQCVEKLAKACLLSEGLSFPKTHDIRELMNMLVPTHPSWSTYATRSALLTQFAVDFRYPGDRADLRDATTAVSICEELHAILREALGVEGQLGFTL